MSILQLTRVTMRFGGLCAVNELDLAIGPGQLYGLIGPNGAGKTTVFNVITGVYTPTSGDDRLRGCVDRRRALRPDHPPRRRAHVPEHPPLRRDVGARQRQGRLRLPPGDDPGHARCCARRRTARRRSASTHQSRELLKIFKLDHLADERAKNLPYGSQRRLEIARAMATVAAAPAPRRAGRRHEPARVDRAHGPDPLDPRPVRHGDPARRAQHEGRHGHLRDRSRPRLRLDDRDRRAGRRSSATPRSSRPTWEGA